MDNILWKKVWTLPNKYLLINKVKEISFKLIHRYYPVKTFIVSKFKLSIDVNCTFCDFQRSLSCIFFGIVIIQENCGKTFVSSL